MSKRATREAYGQALLKLAGKYPNFVVLDADLSAATKTNGFVAAYPERSLNVGIAEQNMVGVAAGISTTGLIPLAGTFSIFATGRAYDQVRQSVAYSNLNVKIIGTHGGLTVGPDGATHQPVEDISMMRSMPNMTVIVPADAIETEKAIEAVIKTPGPFFVRLGREAVPEIMPEDYSFEIGKAVTMREGKDITIITTGVMTAKAVEAIEALEAKGIDAEIINIHTIKPIDKEAIIKSVAKTGKVITAEEHSIYGGLGDMVNHVILSNSFDKVVQVENIGIEDTFGQTGSADELLQYYELTSERIVKEAVGLLQ
ncbi:transketolase family protein [uncultured Sphaerochaeta sp.]|uniref:transketolase family protein n=1 Tax=uncultured Sphaerochaeta sp. TaxID=886478 RepID=UPI002A0A83EA|nr:transketolase family protein [uncultured Sphaerochaeta sp.]